MGRRPGGVKEVRGVEDFIDGIFDFLMDHETSVRVASSVIGSVLGVILSLKVLIPLIVQR